VSGPVWEISVAALWDRVDQLTPETFLAEMTALVATALPGDALALFELASANDSIGREAAAEPLYRRALAAGLPATQRRRATIQLASTLRNLGRHDESVALLVAERGMPSDDLDDAVAAFLALSLTEVGRDREAAGLALTALARHLPRYTRSVTAYARELMEKPPA
jgi:hypothetical protein